MSTQPVFLRGYLSQRNVERVQALLGFAFRVAAQVEVQGRERLPSGGCLVCTNHISIFDAPFVFTLLIGRPITAFAADTYRSHWFYRRFVEMVDAIWVHRGAITPTTIKAALRALREGRTIGVAPEGTRSPTGALEFGKPGAAALAAAAQVPIVPAAITGTERLGESLRRLRRTRLTLVFGEPFYLPPPAPGERAEKLDEYTAEIMCQIAALLPPQYRGVYAGHPRVAALEAASVSEISLKTGQPPDAPAPGQL